MRLIDADALRTRSLRYEWKTVNGTPYWTDSVSVEEIDAAPTVCCERCEYYEDAFCLHPDMMTYINVTESGYNFVPDLPFGCTHFEPMHIHAETPHE